ncbi:MAG: hypothetical protein AAB388_04735 [Patescibacteria group bacterium]
MKYSGALHVHSTHSYDGKLSLSELKSLFASHGLSFACMTEHTDTLTPEAAALFVAECRRLSDETFVFVPGFEVPYEDTHVLHIGTDVFISQIATEEELRAWRAHTALVVLAHPVRNKFKIDATLRECLDGIEIWNQQYEGKSAPRTRSLRLIATERKQKPFFATGGLDLHRIEHFGQPHTHIEAESLSEATVKNALKSGYYTFGHEGCMVTASGVWRPTLRQRLQSSLSVGVITSGKMLNAALARWGVSLPKSWRRFVRGRV